MEAEQEKILEHVKKAVHTLANKKKSWKQKIGNFLVEILIIVIAVNLTVWFHNRNEKKHERELEKNFLIGIRSDLETVRDDVKNNNKFNQEICNYYDSVWTQINKHRIDKDFIDNNSWKLVKNNVFTYDNSRYESFKSSGYLRLIENDTLLTSINRLYTIFFPRFETGEEKLNDERRQNFINNIASKAMDSSGKLSVSKLLDNPEVQFQIFWQKTVFNESISHKQDLIQYVEKVMNDIDKDLKERFNYTAASRK